MMLIRPVGKPAGTTPEPKQMSKVSVLDPVHDLDQGIQRKVEAGEKAECTRNAHFERVSNAAMRPLAKS